MDGAHGVGAGPELGAPWLGSSGEKAGCSPGSAPEACTAPEDDRLPARALAKRGSPSQVLHAEGAAGEVRGGGDSVQPHAQPPRLIERALSSSAQGTERLCCNEAPGSKAATGADPKTTAHQGIGGCLFGSALLRLEPGGRSMAAQVEAEGVGPLSAAAHEGVRLCIREGLSLTRTRLLNRSNLCYVNIVCFRLPTGRANCLRVLQLIMAGCWQACAFFMPPERLA